jgi:two-component system, NarL family, response regulator NreC
MLTTQVIRLLLADDSDAFRSAVSQLLHRQPGIHILGEARSFAEIVRMADHLKPTVVLMDIHMPDERDVNPEIVKTRLHDSTRYVLAMSIWNDVESQQLAVRYGASALLDKSKLALNLIPAIMALSQAESSVVQP